MTANLKPCPNPFIECWSDKVEIRKDSNKSMEFYYGHCTNCGYESEYFDTEAEAIEAWNHRPFEAHAVEVLANAICPDGGYVEQFRAEARALLGWDNDTNDKEK